MQTERKLCPPPVASFIGRNDILNKMRMYFDSGSKYQRIFVLYGLGQEKVNWHLNSLKNINPNGKLQSVIRRFVIY